MRIIFGMFYLDLGLFEIEIDLVIVVFFVVFNVDVLIVVCCNVYIREIVNV